MITIALFLVASAQAMTKKAPAPEPSPSPVVSVSPSPIAQGPGRVRFKVWGGFTSAETKKLADAEQKLADVVASPCFADALSTRNMIQTNGRTPAAVVAHLRSLSGEIPVEMYSKWYSKVVGYTSPTDPVVHTNRKFYAGATACAWASNLGHEGLGHKIGGYDHDFNATKSRPYSVPYSLNFAIEKCCK